MQSFPTKPTILSRPLRSAKGDAISLSDKEIKEKENEDSAISRDQSYRVKIHKQCFNHERSFPERTPMQWMSVQQLLSNMLHKTNSAEHKIISNQP
jgi:hypothetical protein